MTGQWGDPSVIEWITRGCPRKTPESVQNFVSVHKAELGQLGAPDSCSVLGRLVHVFPLRRTPRKAATEAQNGSCTSVIGEAQDAV